MADNRVSGIDPIEEVFAHHHQIVWPGPGRQEARALKRR
jgi:hypothetical protein